MSTAAIRVNLGARYSPRLQAFVERARDPSSQIDPETVRRLNDCAECFLDVRQVVDESAVPAGGVWVEFDLSERAADLLAAFLAIPRN